MKLTSNIPRIVRSYRYTVMDVRHPTVRSSANQANLIRPDAEYYPLWSTFFTERSMKNLRGIFSDNFTSDGRYHYTTLTRLLGLMGIKHLNDIKDDVMLQNIFKEMEEFVKEPPLFYEAYTEKDRVFRKGAAYYYFLGLDYSTIHHAPLTANTSVIIGNGMISTVKKNSYIINNCLSVDKFLDSQWIPESNYLAGFMITKKHYYESRINLLSQPKFDFDYNQVKFFASPTLFDKNGGYLKMGNFLKKYIYPILDRTGIEVINESPNKFFNTKIGAGYSTDALRDYFNTHIDSIETELNGLFGVGYNSSAQEVVATLIN